MTVFASATKNQSKIDFLNKLKIYQKSRETNVISMIDWKLFTMFILVNTSSFGCCISNALIRIPALLRFYLQFHIFVFTINLQCFQIFTYANIIIKELKVLSLVNLNEMNAINLAIFNEKIVFLHELVNDVNNCFNLPILLVTFWNFFSILANANWIVLYFFGNRFAGIVGKFSRFLQFSNVLLKNMIADGVALLFPIAFNVFSLGRSHYATKKAVGAIVVKIAKSQTKTSWKETLLTFIIRKDFQMTSLGFLQFGFKDTSTVRVHTKLPSPSL